MQKLSSTQLKELLNTDQLNGTPEQVRLLAMRVGELCQLNGSNWVTAHADQLLDQWDRVLNRYTKEK